MSEPLAEIWNDPALREQPPVLMDVGASGDPPAVWAPIAAHSVFVGFDPDLRAVRDTSTGRFRREIMVNEAVVADADVSKTKLFLTHSPYCSSTLRPDARGLADFLFSDLFKVVRETEVAATTLGEVIRRFQLPSVDWLKLDTQGIDLRLFQSLAPETSALVLALDIEPGLIDAYEGEDLFVDAHKHLVKSGFWLSDVNVEGTARMKPATLAWLQVEHPDLDKQTIASLIEKSPGWTEARYLRTVESLRERRAARRDYVLLWLFAVTCRKLGFAFDVAAAFAEAFSGDPLASLLKSEPLRQLRSSSAGVPAQPAEPPAQPAERPARRSFLGRLRAIWKSRK